MDQEIDYYNVLGLARSANEKQIGSAYKNLLLKYHPDRNPGDEEAAKIYKSVVEAYNVLSDPNKKRLYDIGGAKAVAGHAVEGESGAPSEGKAFGLGNIFGAVISKLGVPNSTSAANTLSPEFVETAQRICRTGALDGEILASTATDPVRVTELSWGTAVASKVDRHAGLYYRIILDKAHADNGFTISIKSTNKDKFKAVLFDNDGSIVYQDECIKSLDGRSTQIRFLFTKFPAFQYVTLESANVPSSAANTSSSNTITSNSTNSAASIGNLQSPGSSNSNQHLTTVANSIGSIDTAVHSMLSRLDGFQPASKELRVGRYLLGIYGDNFIGKSSVSCLLVAATRNAQVIEQMNATDAEVIYSKQSFHALSAEYSKIKAQYESIIERIHESSAALDAKLETRDAAYKLFLRESVSNSIDTVTNSADVALDTDEDGHRRTSTIQDTFNTTISATAKGSMDTLNKSVSTVSVAGGKAMNATVSATVSVTAATAATASATAASAASTATAATGWLAKRLSTGVATLKTVVAQSTTAAQSSQAQGAATSTDTSADNSSSNTSLLSAEDTSKETIV